MDLLTLLLERLGFKVYKSNETVKTDAEDVPDVLDNPQVNDVQLTQMTDASVPIGVQKMNAYTPGGINNPVVTYGDMRGARPGLVPPVDGRLSNDLELMPPATPIDSQAPLTLEGFRAMQNWFNQTPRHPMPQDPFYGPVY